jgi:NADH-quinone oxidoreductase subunit L
MHGLIKFLPLFPLIGFIFLGIFGKRIKNEKLLGWIGSSMVGLSFLFAVVIFFDMLGAPMHEPHIERVFTWLSIGNFQVDIAYQLDQLSITFALFITGISFLIHVYSIGYMHGDRSFYRFFSYLNLFVFMMLNLVLADNMLLTFLGWEGVGLASYLLIGFWYDQKFDGVQIKWTGDAGMKAFVVNRIGDFGFLIAMFLVFTTFGTLNYTEVFGIATANEAAYINDGLITAIAIMMFVGCTGKSAQLPLAVWLPDAMAGPTSVSALIHAATMVTSGIYLVARNSVLFAMSDTAMMTVAIVGAITAILAASVGLVQNDIKKVLAYSTVSQLGFMFVALGVGAFYIGIFHVITHAFFKGLLFLAAGSVIHGMHHQQNIKMMGGLKKYMPTTHWTFLVGTLAIAGIPIFSGFFSKDEILWYAFNAHHGGIYLWLTLVVAAMFTAFYMFRLYYLTFRGEERFDHKHVHPHESAPTMLFALIALAFFSTFGGFLNIPPMFGLGKPLLKSWLTPIFEDANHILGHHGGAHGLTPWLLMALATGLAFFMWYIAKKWYSDPKWSTPRKLAAGGKGIHKLLLDKYRLDEIYAATVVNPVKSLSESVLWRFFDVNIIDGIVNGTAKAVEFIAEQLRKIQSGVAQNYAVLMMAGIIVIISWLVLSN